MSDMIHCFACGHKIHKTAQTCPSCGVAMIANTTNDHAGVIQNKLSTRRVSIWLGAGILFAPYLFSWFTLRKGYSRTVRSVSFLWLIVVLYMIGANQKKSQPLASSEPKQMEQSGTAGKEPDTKTFALNQEFRLGDFSYRVLSAVATTDVGSKYLRHNAGEGAVLIIINFSIKNETNETESVLTDDFEIVDYKGRKFSPSSDIKTALASANAADIFLTELQPGLAKKTYVGFEVPEDVIGSPYKLIIPEKGFSSNNVEITIVSK